MSITTDLVGVSIEGPTRRFELCSAEPAICRFPNLKHSTSLTRRKPKEKISKTKIQKRKNKFESFLLNLYGSKTFSSFFRADRLREEDIPIENGCQGSELDHEVSSNTVTRYRSNTFSDCFV